MVASEATPFIKTGGLADVIGSLPAALHEIGEEVRVVLPWYREARVESHRLVLDGVRIWLGKAWYPMRVHEAMAGETPYFLVECAPLFDRDGAYGGDSGDFPDNHVRFAVLSRAAIALARRVFRPQVLHCHDWQAAHVPIYARNALAGDPTLLGVKLLLTIHNLGYQGIFPASAVEEMGLDGDVFHPSGLEFYGKVNLLKGAILASDAITTVSRAYAREIQTPEYGFGLEGVLGERRDSLTGILNGVDYSRWDPAHDTYLAAPFSSTDMAGKQACKRDLLKQAGLPEKAMSQPLIGMISRLVSQKGLDILEDAAAALAAEEASLVVLGTGQAHYEEFLQALAAAHPGKIAVKIAYDDALAHRIEAGADIFLMPSHYEPCGLNQIYSLRYGAVPVVRATGGLDDTIDESTGFKFQEYSGRALVASVRAALAAWRDREKWRGLMLGGMEKDYSWRKSAGEYAELYRGLAVNPRHP
jgi:starch synthase